MAHVYYIIYIISHIYHTYMLTIIVLALGLPTMWVLYFLFIVSFFLSFTFSFFLSVQPLTTKHVIYYQTHPNLSTPCPTHPTINVVDDLPQVFSSLNDPQGKSRLVAVVYPSYIHDKSGQYQLSRDLCSTSFRRVGR